VAGGTRLVSFQVKAETRWGDTVLLVGSTPQLGSWAPERGLELSTDGALYPMWRLPTAQALAIAEVHEFKFVIRRVPHEGRPGGVEWEPLPENRRLQLGPEAPAELRLEMEWATPRTLAWRRSPEARGVPHVAETPATFQTAPSPLGGGIFGGSAAQRQAAQGAVFPSFGAHGASSVSAHLPAPGPPPCRSFPSSASIASSIGEDRDRNDIPAHYLRPKAASRAVSALDLGASLLSPPDSP